MTSDHFHATITGWEENMKIPDVAKWQLLYVEKVVVNKRWRSSLIKRFFVDPMQKLGLGATISAFYKDGTELLLAVHWKIGTSNAREAYRTPENTWRTSKPMIIPYTLSIQKEFEEYAKTSGKCSFDSISSYAVELGEKVAGSDSVLYFDRHTASLSNFTVPPPTK